MGGEGSGGVGGGDNDADTGGVGWDVNQSGDLVPADGLANDPDKTDGWDTYTEADSALGQLTGDRRSDQQVFDDVAVTAAMEAGHRNFTNSRGREMAVADYSRNFAPTDTGILGGMNRAPGFKLGPVSTIGKLAGLSNPVTMGMSIAEMILGVPSLLSVEANPNKGINVSGIAVDAVNTVTGKTTSTTTENERQGGSVWSDLAGLPGQFISDLTAVVTGKSVPGSSSGGVMPIDAPNDKAADRNAAVEAEIGDNAHVAPGDAYGVQISGPNTTTNDSILFGETTTANELDSRNPGVSPDASNDKATEDERSGGLADLPGQFISDLVAVITGKSEPNTLSGGKKATGDDRFITNNDMDLPGGSDSVVADSLRRRRDQSLLSGTSVLDEDEDPLALARKARSGQNSLLSNGFGGF